MTVVGPELISADAYATAAFAMGAAAPAWLESLVGYESLVIGPRRAGLVHPGLQGPSKRAPGHDAGVVLPTVRRTMKYFACGWWQMMAAVVCSGWNCQEVSSEHADPGPLGAYKPGAASVVFEVGARRVPPRVTPSPVLLAEQPVQVRPVLRGKTPLLTNAVVPVLSQSLGHFDGKAVQVQVIGVAVLGKKLGSLLGGCLAHGHHAGTRRNPARPKKLA